MFCPLKNLCNTASHYGKYREYMLAKCAPHISMHESHCTSTSAMSNLFYNIGSQTYQLKQLHPWQHLSSLKKKNRIRNTNWILSYTTIPNHHQQIHKQKKGDKQNISKLLNEYVEVPATITNAIRIGKQPNLTKVTVSSVQEKSFILHNRRSLHNKSYYTRLDPYRAK